MIYWICFWFMKLVDRIYFRTEFIGKEHLPADKNFILAANHISNIDPFILGISAKRKYSYVAKESLFENLTASFLFKKVGAIPIKRDGADFKAIREILKRLKHDCPVIVFPEGTRGVGDRAKKTQPGVGLIALKAEVPVIPAFIEGSDKGLPNGAKWFKRHKITIKFGPALSFPSDQSYHEIASIIMKHIYQLAQ